MARRKIFGLGLITLFVAVTFGVQLADYIMQYFNLAAYLPSDPIPFLGKPAVVVKSAFTAFLTWVGLQLIKLGILPKR